MSLEDTEMFMLVINRAVLLVTSIWRKVKYCLRENMFWGSENKVLFPEDN